ATEMVNMRIRSEGPRGPQTVATRDAYLWIDHNTPQETVVLFNPDIYIEYFSSLYGYRQVVSVGQAYGPFFAVGPVGEETLHEATAFFSHDEPQSDVRAFCSRFHATAILVQATDPVWSDRNSWVWHMHPSFANDLARVYTARDLEQAF